MCTETAAAMPTSAGPISRATMKAEAKESPAAAVASSPDQKTFPAIRRLSEAGLRLALHRGVWVCCGRTVRADDRGAADGST
jgi:hypothetical protein